MSMVERPLRINRMWNLRLIMFRDDDLDSDWLAGSQWERSHTDSKRPRGRDRSAGTSISHDQFSSTYRLIGIQLRAPLTCLQGM